MLTLFSVLKCRTNCMKWMRHECQVFDSLAKLRIGFILYRKNSVLQGPYRVDQFLLYQKLKEKDCMINLRQEVKQQLLEWKSTGGFLFSYFGESVENIPLEIFFLYDCLQRRIQRTSLWTLWMYHPHCWCINVCSFLQE